MKLTEVIGAISQRLLKRKRGRWCSEIRGAWEHEEQDDFLERKVCRDAGSSFLQRLKVDPLRNVPLTSQVRLLSTRRRQQLPPSVRHPYPVSLKSSEIHGG